MVINKWEKKPESNMLGMVCEVQIAIGCKNQDYVIIIKIKRTIIVIAEIISQERVFQKEPFLICGHLILNDG